MNDNTYQSPQTASRPWSFDASRAVGSTHFKIGLADMFGAGCATYLMGSYPAPWWTLNGMQQFGVAFWGLMALALIYASFSRLRWDCMEGMLKP